MKTFQDPVWTCCGAVDTTYIAEDAPGIEDTEVMERARRQVRILLTSDKDFYKLIFTYGLPAPPGVVYFRFTPVAPWVAAVKLLSMLRTGQPQLNGNFTRVRKTKIGQRVLPS